MIRLLLIAALATIIGLAFSNDTPAHTPSGAPKGGVCIEPPLVCGPEQSPVSPLAVDHRIWLPVVVR